MSTATASSLEALEPHGYLRLVCKDTGELCLRADQLKQVRAWQLEGPPAWVHAVDRAGDPISFYWPSIRRVEVCTLRGAVFQRALDKAIEAEFPERDWE